MTPYINTNINIHKMKENEETEWGHFIDIDYSLHHISNRNRSITCPVIYGNKVYQKPYNYGVFKQTPVPKVRTEPTRYDKECSIMSHPLIYMTKNIVEPCIRLLNREYINKPKDIPLYVNNIKTTKPLENKEIIENQHQTMIEINTSQYNPMLNNTYYIDEIDEIDELDELYEYNKHHMNDMNPTMMAIVSIISMCAVYMMV